MLPQTIVVNVRPDVATDRILPRMQWSTRVTDQLDQVSLAIDGETISFWAGTYRPELLARIPWEAVVELKLGPDRAGLGRNADFSQAEFVVRDGDREIGLRFAIMALPGEATAGQNLYADARQLQLFIHYARARRHGTMPPKRENLPSATRVPLRDLLIPIIVGVSILITFAVVIVIGLSSS